MFKSIREDRMYKINSVQNTYFPLFIASEMPKI